jgi:hypothetical protein
MPNTTVPAADTGLPNETEEARKNAAFDRFQSLFADWLEIRAKGARPSAEETDEEADAMCNRLEDLARLIMVTPAPVPWAIFQKIQVLEYAMVGDAGDSSDWADNRTTMMLGCIKADLMGFRRWSNE